MKKIVLNAEGLHYKVLNEEIHKVLNNNNDIEELVLENVCGQRYIAAGLKNKIKIVINGTAGNDLGVFMDGTTVVVNDNAQDAVGNTMNSGEIIIYGNAGDIIGYGMRGGEIYIKGDVGYRVGIHMKAYKENFPVIVIGGDAKDFLGEYMAGGLIIVLGLNKNNTPVGDFVGTGMHGGKIFVRTEGNLEKCILGKEVKVVELDKEDTELLKKYIDNFCKHFGFDNKEVLNSRFVKLYPYSHRPYGKLYAY
jgi:glutamate synthase domain-containing protein 3